MVLAIRVGVLSRVVMGWLRQLVGVDTRGTVRSRPHLSIPLPH
jgi:hypothetical protein